MNRLVEALLDMEEYLGPLEAFLVESVTVIQRIQGCSPEEADRILQDLRAEGRIAFEFTPGGELPPTANGIPRARWYWYQPEAA